MNEIQISNINLCTIYLYRHPRIYYFYFIFYKEVMGPPHPPFINIVGGVIDPPHPPRIL